MDEIINIKINGDAITKDSNVAGNQYECNSKKLRLTFSDNWDGFGKSITFWNAIGENAVKIQLGMDELEDWGNSRVYIVPIPGEAMTVAGNCSFVIEGEVDGIIKRTASDKLKVKYSPKAENAGNPESVTPDLATQLRNEIDSMYVDIAEIKQVGDEVNAGLGKVEEAVSLVQSAEQSAIAADNSAWGAVIEAENARDAIANMTVEAETLPPGSDASVVRTDGNGVLGLMFGIPEGNSGVYVGSEEPTDPDVKVWIDTSGEEDTNYVTRDEMDEDLLRQQSQIIAYTDLKYAWKTDLSEYATKEDLSNVSVDMSDYYTKGETREVAREIAEQTVSTSQDFMDLLGDVRVMQETVAYQSDLSDYATKGEVDSQMDELESIAKGRATGYVFNTLADLEAWLSDSANTANLVLGDNLYIRATNVPDYWWDGASKQELETQKVDLTEYVKNTDHATANVAGVVKVATSSGVGMHNGNLYVACCSTAEIDARTNTVRPIVPANLEYAVKSVGDGYYATKNEMAEDYLRQQSEIIAYTDMKYAWKTDIGDIESALDSILAIQESIVGGVN